MGETPGSGSRDSRRSNGSTSQNRGSGPQASTSSTRSESRTRAHSPERASTETVSASTTAIATILGTLTGALVLALGVDVLVPGVVATIAGGLLTATVTATKRRTPGARAAGSLLVVVTAVGISASVGLAATGGPSLEQLLSRVGVVLAIVLATFGATATVTGAIGNNAVRSALPVALLTALPIAVVAALHIDPVRDRVHESVVGPLEEANPSGIGLERILSPENLTGSAVTFVVLLVGSLWLTAYILPRLPIPELVPRDRRSETRRRIDWVASRSIWSGTFLLIGSIVVGIFTVPAQNEDLQYVEDVVPVSLFETYLEPVTMATELRIVLLAGIGVLTTAYLLSRLPGLHRLRYSTTLRWVPVFIGGVFVTALVTVGYPRVFEHWVRPEVEQSIAEQETVFLPILEEELQLQELLPILSPPNGIAIAGLGITGIVGAVLGVFLLLWLLGSFQLLPDRGAPGTIGAAALVGGTIIAATAGASTLVVTGGVACAIVSWDAAVYGVSVTEELGRDTDVGRPTLSHTLGAVLVGVVGIGIALGLNRLAEAITVQTGVTIAISLIVGLLVSFIAVKRRATSKAITTRSTTASPRTTAATDHSVSAAGDDSVATAKDATVSVDTVPLLDVHEARMLRAAGFETIGDLQAASQSELEAVTGVSDETVAAVIAAVADGKDRNE